MKLLPLITLAALMIAGTPLARAGWTQDYDQAVATAKTEGKFVFLNFTTSDRNPVTARSNNEILGQAKFNEFANDKLVLVDVYMYPKSKIQPEYRKRNEALAQQYGITKFPAAVVTDAGGKELGQLEYAEGGVDAFLAKLSALLPSKQ
jgi:thioredoxin-related protein